MQDNQASLLLAFRLHNTRTNAHTPNPEALHRVIIATGQHHGTELQSLLVDILKS